MINSIKGAPKGLRVRICLEKPPHLENIIIRPAHELFSKLFLTGFIRLAIVDVVEGVDTCVVT